MYGHGAALRLVCGLPVRIGNLSHLHEIVQSRPIARVVACETLAWLFRCHLFSFWSPWLASVSSFDMCFAAHGGFVCASDKHDVAKVEFTLAALEAEAPFAKEVSVVDFGLLAVARCVAR